jgi:CRP-like cAMP-binding protein
MHDHTTSFTAFSDFSTFSTFSNYVQHETGLSATDTERALAIAEPCLRTIAKDDFFLQAGSVCRSTAYIQQGALLYFRENDHADKLVCDVLFEGMWATYVESLMTGNPSDMNIQALEETTIIELRADKLQAAYDAYPALERFARKLSEESFITVARRMADLQFLSAEERYDKLTSSDQRLISRVPQYFLASLLGITPQSLSRLRSKRV